MKVSLLIPTLNEIGGLKEIMPRIKRGWVEEIVIVDGGSTDGTIEYAEENGYRLIQQKNKGLVSAYIESVKELAGDVVITFSPDGNSIPELIVPLIEKMKEGYDMVIVSRYAKGAKSYDDDLVTHFGNWLFTAVINLLHGSRYTDAMVIYRAWKKRIFYELDLDKNKSYSFEEEFFNTKVGVEPMLSVRAAKRKLKCADIPGDEPLRISGERKLQVIRWGMAYMFEVIKEVFIWR